MVGAHANDCYNTYQILKDTIFIPYGMAYCFWICGTKKGHSTLRPPLFSLSYGLLLHLTLPQCVTLKVNVGQFTLPSLLSNAFFHNLNEERGGHFSLEKTSLVVVVKYLLSV
jgi:hypothetical protein